MRFEPDVILAVFAIFMAGIGWARADYWRERARKLDEALQAMARRKFPAYRFDPITGTAELVDYDDVGPPGAGP